MADEAHRLEDGEVPAPTPDGGHQGVDERGGRQRAEQGGEDERRRAHACIPADLARTLGAT